MPDTSATTPPNPFGIKIPAAQHGARQLPIPQPATEGEARSLAFCARLRAAASAQVEANNEAFQARQAGLDARPYVAPPSDAAAAGSGQPERSSTSGTVGAGAAKAAAPEGAAGPSVAPATYMPAGANWPAPGAAAVRPPAEPSLTNWQWPSVSAAADQAITPPSLPSEGASLADRMRERHASALPASTVAAAGSPSQPEPSLADRMAAHFGVTIEPVAAESVSAAILPSQRR